MNANRSLSWQLGVVAAACCALLAGCTADHAPISDDLENALNARLGGDDVSGYARAEQPRAFDFPADHGPHPAYRNEWWYLTGNLTAEDGRRFGYQATFFRIALAPPSPQLDTRASAWASRQVWMTHVALSDASAGQHHAQERFARGAAGLAGAQAEPFRVWLEDWQLGETPDKSDDTWRLSIEARDFAYEFKLEPLKPVVLQGEAGLSQKSNESGNASYYYSMPRLRTTGRIRVGGREYPVNGLSWLDREWSTSALGPDQEGWDWFALQLDDDRDLMFYQLRRKDGSADPLSAGSLVDPAGAVRRLSTEDVELSALRWWQSPDGARYPVAWQLELFDGSRYRVEAVFDEQHMTTSVRYWEGMVDVLDDQGERLGQGYLELAGYE